MSRKHCKIIAILIFLCLTSCKSPDSIRAMIPSKDLVSLGVKDVNLPPETPVLLWLTGKPAEIYTQSLADNNQSNQAVVNKIYKWNGTIYLLSFVVLLAGIAFWVINPLSKWKLVLPAVGLSGIVLIRTFTEYGGYISLGVVVIGSGILLFKLWDYLKDRNLLFNKKGK